VTPRRLRRLQTLRVGGLDVRVARSPRARLLGLALLRDLPAGTALLIPRCGSVHTFGMCFRIDVVFLDGAGRRCARCTACGHGAWPRAAAPRRSWSGAPSVME
jgi:hypothetical protein